MYSRIKSFMKSMQNLIFKNYIHMFSQSDWMSLSETDYWAGRTSGLTGLKFLFGCSLYPCIYISFIFKRREFNDQQEKLKSALLAGRTCFYYKKSAFLLWLIFCLISLNYVIVQSYT